MISLLMLLCQDELKVVSFQRADAKFRVTIRGSSAEKDGTVIRLRVLPRTYQLLGNGSLALATVEVGSVVGIAEVRKKSFTFTFATSRLHDFDVQVGNATHALRLFDAEHLRSTHPRELKRFAGYLREVRAFVDHLEPFNEKKVAVPSKLLREMLDVENRLRPWAEATELAAAAGAITSLLSEMGLKIPFETAQNYDDGPYGALPVRPQGSMEIPAWRDRLRVAEETAIRETFLLMLAQLEEHLSSKGAASVLAKLCLSPENGDLAEAFRAYGPSADLADLLTRLRTAIDKAEPLDGLKSEIRQARGRIAS